MLSEPIDRQSHRVDAVPGSNVVPLPVTPVEAEPAERLPRRALAYVLGVFAAGLLAIAYFGPQLDTSDIGGLVVLVLIALYLIRIPLKNAGAADEPPPPSAVI